MLSNCFFLKSAVHIIAAPICSIFNLSLQTGVFPQDWKSAAVTPLFKGGDSCDLNCYRPISILLSLSKFFERLINTQLIDHLESKNLVLGLDTVA